MDGWHYTRAHLATFPNPTEAKDRRGAAFTFDAASFSEFVSLLKTRPQEVVKAPSFDHALKDPVEEDVEVRPEHRIVIIEGLYCNCDDGEWAKGAQLLDERWVVEVERDVARQRLRVRHVETGVAKDEEEALWRGEYVREVSPLLCQNIEAEGAEVPALLSPHLLSSGQQRPTQWRLPLVPPPRASKAYQVSRGRRVGDVIDTVRRARAYTSNQTAHIDISAHSIRRNS